MLQRSASYLYRPESADEVMGVLDLARASGRPLVPRGSGYSYGDTSLLREGIALDLRRMNRVLEWDSERGIIQVEAGATIRDLWHTVLPDGWWPPVVPGVLGPTVGGVVAVNAHGKNNWRMGTIGDHVLDLQFLTAEGEQLTLSREQEPELFHAAISGIGMLGIILSVRMRMGRIRSGYLAVSQYVAADLDAMFRLLGSNEAAAHYMVGWIDGFGTGPALGRGLVQVATGNTREFDGSFALSDQDPPLRIAGLMPRSQLWRILRPLTNDPGMRAVNLGRMVSGRVLDRRETLVPQAQFQFFHDYVPNWKRSFLPGGIVQYQLFVLADASRRVFGTLLEESQREGVMPYLAVLKRHRSDQPFLLGYNLDGYSLSLDYHVTRDTLPRVQALLGQWTDDIVLPSGGRFYLAKDSVLTRAQARRMYGDDVYQRFRALKAQLDPDGILQSEMYRRLFA